jgi:tRNA 5-methylaminomethyl-2-thiouridine biosynthesis bifunctional protein
LVRAWLATPGVSFQGATHVQSVLRVDGHWQALMPAGQVAAQAPVVVLAAALGSAALCEGRLQLQPVRGQVSWGLRTPDDGLPPFPVNGNGHLLPALPLPEGLAWLTGSTYGHADPDSTPRAEDQATNLDRLHGLLPRASASLAPAFTRGQARAWAGVRCASTDRRPLVGALSPGLWVSTAMGSRGLTLSALCAQLLAARLCHEALPMPGELAQALDVARQTRASARA